MGRMRINVLGSGDVRLVTGEPGVNLASAIEPHGIGHSGKAGAAPRDKGLGGRATPAA
jgi:hypothetical protein